MNHRSEIFNLPNQLTMARIALTIVLVVTLEMARDMTPNFTVMASGPTATPTVSAMSFPSATGQAIVYGLAFLMFVIAAGTDWLDGYYARKYGMETTLGRILDPFADKLIICGTFTLLLAHPLAVRGPWGLAPWMVVVLTGRELLITVIRGYVEGRGVNFGAKWLGKWKMGLQCIAAGGFLLLLTFGALGMIGININGELRINATGTVAGLLRTAWWFTVASLWSAIVLTLWSAWQYIIAAIRISRQLHGETPETP